MVIRKQINLHTVAWTEEAHQWSWRMKLRDKDGVARFFIHSKDGKPREINPYHYVTAKQYSKVQCRPELIQQLAYHLAKEVNTTSGYW